MVVFEKFERLKKVLNIVIVFVVGLFIGVGLVFFIEYFDNIIKIFDDVEKFL